MVRRCVCKKVGRYLCVCVSVTVCMYVCNACPSARHCDRKLICSYFKSLTDKRLNFLLCVKVFLLRFIFNLWKVDNSNSKKMLIHGSIKSLPPISLKNNCSHIFLMTIFSIVTYNPSIHPSITLSVDLISGTLKSKYLSM